MRKDAKIKHANMTSFETWSVLCYLLNEALHPAVVYSDVAFEIASSCMALSTSAKRKISAHSSQELLEWLFNEILSCVVDPSADKKHALVTELLERGVERNILYDYALRVRVIGVKSNNPKIDGRKIIKHTDIYLNLYEEFRMDLVRRYTAFTETSAKRNNAIKSKGGLLSSEGDQVNVYTISMLRAIDKFVPYKGTLTSYIQQWFLNAEGASSYMSYTDEAYSMPRQARKQVQEGALHNRNRVVPMGIGDSNHALVAKQVVQEAMVPDSPLGDIDSKAMHAISQLPKSPLLWLIYDLSFDPLAEENR